MSNINPDALLGATSFSATRGETPNPWFTVANQFIPRNLHDVIKWSRYITIHSPTTTEVIRKLCTYPITEFLIDTNSPDVEKKYKEIFNSFKLKQTLEDIGFDYYTLGNVFISIYFPITRVLQCPTCKTDYTAKKADFLIFKNFYYEGTCPNTMCGYKGQFKRRDIKSVSVDDMNIIKWDPENIAVAHNPITGEHTYYYKIPNDIRRKVRLGDRLIVDSIPWEMIEAIKKNQDFKFDQNNLFHLRNISTGAQVEGCSIPPLISLYNLVFYQATLRKANEAIALEHMNPMRVVFPSPNGGTDPVVAMSLRNFTENVEGAIKKHKRDRNYFLISPAPLGYQAIGGDGKNLLVSQEIEQAEETILLSLGVSKELLSGQTNWTSSTVGLRMLSNTMQSYVTQIEGVISWIMKKVATYLNLAVCEITLTPFRLADDDIMKQNLIQLAQNGDVSQSTLYESMGIDFSKEQEKLVEDAVIKARTQVKAQFEVEQATFLEAKKTGDKLDRNTDYQAKLAQAQEIANQLSTTDAGMVNEVLGQIKLQDYPLFILVAKLLEERAAQAAATPQDPNAPDASGGKPGDKSGGSGKPSTPPPSE